VVQIWNPLVDLDGILYGSDDNEDDLDSMLFNPSFNHFKMADV
jgi:hypothetical protein